MEEREEQRSEVKREEENEMGRNFLDGPESTFIYLFLDWA